VEVSCVLLYALCCVLCAVCCVLYAVCCVLYMLYDRRSLLSACPECLSASACVALSDVWCRAVGSHK
jgi:hypothetical protein